MSSSMSRIRPKNAAIVGLGWWGQHILRQMIGSDIVRIGYAVGSREEHRAHANRFEVTFTTDFARVLGDGSIDVVNAICAMCCCPTWTTTMARVLTYR
jgi:predicted dehydrogenase